MWLALVAIFIGVACFLAEAACRAAATWFLLSDQNKLGKEKARLAGGCPAELTALLHRSVQTAAGNLKDIYEWCAKFARVGFSKWCSKVLEAGLEPLQIFANVGCKQTYMASRAGQVK